MKYKRSSGILFHPTSLPGPDGIGDLGPQAYAWIDFLHETGCALWQVLPLGPTGYGDSPYQSFSAFAGNPYLVSPTILLDEDLLTRQDLVDRPKFSTGQVDFGPVIEWKVRLLDRAYDRFKGSSDSELGRELSSFQKDQAYWLDDYTMFMAIKEAQGGGSWDKWPAILKHRDQSALDRFRKENPDAIQRHVFRQFIFFRQWQALHTYANQAGIMIIGDAPIFVSYDSADVWAHPELFYLDQKGLPSVVAGVPPDYFSKTGQLWGNPLYHWDIHKDTGYSWWIDRLSTLLKVVDVVRLDHFRGFAGYWEIPYGNPTAEIGRWVPGPGADLFTAVNKALGDLPIIAEDLGVVTPDVIELREKFELPGMKLFQFAFSTDPDDPFLPHNFPENCIAYTGTHDNDTVIGWYKTAPKSEQDFCRRYLSKPGNDIAWDMIRGIWGSVASVAIAPLQDFLRLDTNARMNYPGRPEGNWTWRVSHDAFTDELTQNIHEINYLYGRSLSKTTVKNLKRNCSGR